MMKKSRSVKTAKVRRSLCPINFALETFGDMWSLLIIRDIIIFHKNTYGEFLESDEKIATNILADRLRKLEKAGVIKKTPHGNDKRKDVYRLTKKGLDLVPILVEMTLWSAKYDAKTPVPKAYVEYAKHDRSGLISSIRDGKYIHPRI